LAIVEVNGTRIAYDEYGAATSGPNVVFLHAFPLNRLMWQSQTDELRGIAHLVLPDMRGFGSSDVESGAIAIEQMADDVYALVEKLELAPVVLVGLSMGGYVALAYIRKYPESVRGLVLADTRADADSDEARQNRQAMIDEVAASGPARVAELMLPKLLSKDGQEQAELVAEIRRMIETTSPGGIVGALRGMADRADSTDLLASIAVPTLVVVGAEDAVTPPEIARELADRIPGAELEIIDDAGHLSNVEEPTTFNAAVSRFLQSLGKAAAEK
jgi:pimeloyl-ACP methyl ester carboxylesterase